MKSLVFGRFFYCFWDYRSTKQLRLFSGKLPAMFFLCFNPDVHQRRLFLGNLPAVFWTNATRVPVENANKRPYPAKN